VSDGKGVGPRGLSQPQAERVARACLVLAEAAAELGAALVGDEVLDKVEADDMPPEERAITGPLAECGDPPCGPHHDHYVDPAKRQERS
jgi:hypothetical protein